MKRDFLSLNDLSRTEIEDLLDRAIALKAGRAAGLGGDALAGCHVGMIFNKPSLRTQVSFQVGIQELGGRVVSMSDAEIQLGRREPIDHAARVLSRYLHCLVVRTFAQEDIEEMAREADIPVINALTDKFHPCQLLADLQTVMEKKGRLAGLKAAWIGDGNNMANSWINAAALMGIELSLAVPEGYDPDPEVLALACSLASAPIAVTRDPAEAARGADMINTDVWASMGQEAEAEKRRAVFRPYQVNAELTALAAPDAVVLHCLPAHLGDEITREVVEGPQSVVFDQAENRLHAQKALLEFLVCGRGA